MKTVNQVAALAVFALPLVANAQSSCGPAPSGSIRPSLASGYQMQVVATGLAKPRGILFDSAGHLLVVEQDTGSISAHTLSESNGCVSVSESRNITDNLELEHGIAISEDGSILYASNADAVYEWDYNAEDRTIGDSRTVIDGMGGTGHTTRTLLLSRVSPGWIVVGRGSGPNLDIEAENYEETGSSTVKAFNLNDRSEGVAYDYITTGTLLGSGLRNEVGIGEHPETGGIWTVENSADQLRRDDEVISEDNPAEELNFLGYLNGTETENQGSNFGYPWCFAVWDRDALPDNDDLQVGDQFALSEVSALNNENRTDAYCANTTGPRLSFQAHMAPMDIKFNNSAQQAFITFRGSWNRETPIGYKLSVVNFTNGEPTEPATSTTALVDILKNEDDTRCPDNCFRPVGIAFDAQGRIFVAADTSGEIYMITRDASAPITPNPTTTGGSSTPTNAASPIYQSTGLGYLVAAIAGLLLMF